jgi:hypothetical protein
MGNVPDTAASHPGCEACSRACEEAKSKSSTLEKKNFRLAIALTSALTLLGEQGVKAVVSVVESMRSVADAEADTKETAAAGSADDGYNFGKGGRASSGFSRWMPSWKYPPESGPDGDIWLPPEGWSPSRDVDISAAGSYMAAAVSAPPIRHVDMLAPTALPTMTAGDTPILAGVVPADVDDFTTPSPFGGYRAHLETGPAHVSTVPSPGAIWVFAVGGMFGSRSRA